MRIKAEDMREIQGMKPVLEECWFLSGEVEHYSKEQMREVFAGVMGYQTERCVKLYSSHALSANQMHEIRCGIEDGLSYEEVLAYSTPELSWQAMRSIRRGLLDRKSQAISIASGKCGPCCRMRGL